MLLQKSKKIQGSLGIRILRWQIRALDTCIVAFTTKIHACSSLILLLLMDIYVPQSYCMSLVSGNWKHTLVAMGWRKSALGESSWESSSFLRSSCSTREGLGWWVFMVMVGAVAGGTVITNLRMGGGEDNMYHHRQLATFSYDNNNASSYPFV